MRFTAHQLALLSDTSALEPSSGSSILLMQSYWRMCWGTTRCPGISILSSGLLLTSINKTWTLYDFLFFRCLFLQSHRLHAIQPGPEDCSWFSADGWDPHAEVTWYLQCLFQERRCRIIYICMLFHPGSFFGLWFWFLCISMFQVWCTRWRTFQSLRTFLSLVSQRLALVVLPVCALPPLAPHPPPLLIMQLLIWAPPASSTVWMTHWTSAHKGEYVTMCGFITLSCVYNSVIQWKLGINTNFICCWTNSLNSFWCLISSTSTACVVNFIFYCICFVLTLSQPEG